MKKLLLIGAGGHGKVVADVAEQSERWDEILFLDEEFPKRKHNGVWSIVATPSRAKGMFGEYRDAFVSIGDAEARMRWIAKLMDWGYEIPTLIHPRSVVSRYARIDKGSVVMPLACINAGARLGKGVIVNTSATVDHDCVVEDGVHLAPGVHLSGDVQVGEGAWLGTGASCIQGLRVGAGAMVGAGATVIRDIPDRVTAVGTPARLLGGDE